MSFATGTLVKARGREWVVLPGSEDDLLLLRPLGGTEDEVVGVLPALEVVTQAHFDPPTPDDVGDFVSARLLRDALRLSFRSSAGPFRSFGQIAVEPRPYQLVPLMMALKLEPVRMLIADDVGIGKTIESALIAKELLAQGDIERLAVLCPPHLADQWQMELREKFHIDAEVVLPSTVSKLERGTRVDQSLFDVHPFVVVSIDYIKSDRRRDEFIRTCPEFVIVDEAHGAAFGMERGGQQRNELVGRLASDPDRHLILVTATPHSGKEDAFRSLLTFLDPDFTNLPDDLTGPKNEDSRRRLAQHFVQRRRGDIRTYLGEETELPDREAKEETYSLSPEYKKFFSRVLDYVRDTTFRTEEGEHRRRVRWWSALALLRSIGSSPAAAAATLVNRATVADTETPEQADEVGRRTVMDLADDDTSENVDVAPGGDFEPEEDDDARHRRKLREFAREAEKLRAKSDAKLEKAVELVEELVADGFRPIVFCRFIQTAEYVAEGLRKKLKGVEVAAVTGLIPAQERPARVQELTDAVGKHVLVATDCLSEGINLQEHFDAVFHYDLLWNPTRHEQREGRVDRFGQPKDKVRVLTYYGADNQIDGIVLDVLIRKHEAIRNSLGISVPVPQDSEALMGALMEGLMLKAPENYDQLRLEVIEPQRKEIHAEWDVAAERERRTRRTLFAQHSLKPEEVQRELEAVRAAIGSAEDVERFVRVALEAHGGQIKRAKDAIRIDASSTPQALQDSMGTPRVFEAKFDLPVDEGQLYLGRTSPVVEGVASYVVDTALDPVAESVARRAGVIRTNAVDEATTLLLIRYRFDVTTRKGKDERPLLAEESRVLAFCRSPTDASWLDTVVAEALLSAVPTGNVAPEQTKQRVAQIVQAMDTLRPHIDSEAEARKEELLDAHRRVRTAAGARGVTFAVEPKLPADVLGVYVFLPVPKI
jgi:superfamily II DNA or RNA helicase